MNVNKSNLGIAITFKFGQCISEEREDYSTRLALQKFIVHRGIKTFYSVIINPESDNSVCNAEEFIFDELQLPFNLSEEAILDYEFRRDFSQLVVDAVKTWRSHK